MTILYAIVSSYYNGCDVFEDVVEIYQDFEEAGLRILELEEVNHSAELSYHTREYKLK